MSDRTLYAGEEGSGGSQIRVFNERMETDVWRLLRTHIKEVELTDGTVANRVKDFDGLLFELLVYVEEYGKTKQGSK